MVFIQWSANGSESISENAKHHKSLCITAYMADPVVIFKGLLSEESDDMKKVFSMEDHVKIKRIGKEVSRNKISEAGTCITEKIEDKLETVYY